MVEIRLWSKSNLPLPVFETAGRIVFDPDRGGMKSRIHNWVVINLDYDLAAYYRWHFRKNWYRVDLGGRRRPIYEPSWGAHVSVVRGEQAHWLPPERRQEMWWEARRRFHGLRVPVFYSNHIRQTGGDRPDHFWFIDAYSECVLGIRNLLQLPNADSRTGRPYSSHITIGRTY